MSENTLKFEKLKSDISGYCHPGFSPGSRYKETVLFLIKKIKRIDFYIPGSRTKSGMTRVLKALNKTTIFKFISGYCYE